MSDKATVGELENMSINDVELAGEALDAWEEASARAAERAYEKAKAAR